MDAYFDSAIIVKLYVKEATSPDAIAVVGAYVAPYWLTQWQALEIKNAIRLKAFRQEITAAEMNQSITAFEQDIATGRWQRPVYTAASVEQKADELSASHSATLEREKWIHDLPVLLPELDGDLAWNQIIGDTRARPGLTALLGQAEAEYFQPLA